MDSPCVVIVPALRPPHTLRYIDSDVQETHVTLENKIPREQIIKLQQEEFAGIIKNVRKHQEKLSHLYIIDKDGILK